MEKKRVDVLAENPAVEFLKGLNAVEKEPTSEEQRSDARRVGTVRICLALPFDLMDRVERVVCYTPKMTKTKLFKIALEKELALREAQNGGPFPEVPED